MKLFKIGFQSFRGIIEYCYAVAKNAEEAAGKANKKYDWKIEIKSITWVSDEVAV